MQNTEATPRGWLRFRPAPDMVVYLLLAAEGLWWLSDRFKWFSFNQRWGWSVFFCAVTMLAALLLMLLWFVVAMLLRRRFQFSLRALLLLAPAVALPCGWLATELREVRQEDDAAAALAKRDIKIDYVYDARTPPTERWGLQWLRVPLGGHFFNRACSVQCGVRPPSESDIDLLRKLPKCDMLFLLAPAITDDGVARIATLPQVTNIIFDGSPKTELTAVEVQSLTKMRSLRFLRLCRIEISTDGMREFKNMRTIEYLSLLSCNAFPDLVPHLIALERLNSVDLAESRMTDASFDYLAKMHCLRELYLLGSQITDSSLRHLGSCRQIELLVLQMTSITDGGLAHLTELKQLRRLTIRDNAAISDAGLRHLEDMKWLQLLVVEEPKVTQPAIDRLRKALPNCKVNERPQ